MLTRFHWPGQMINRFMFVAIDGYKSWRTISNSHRMEPLMLCLDERLYAVMPMTLKKLK